VRVGRAHGLDQLVDDVLRRRTVGIAHAEVDDVLAPAARGHLELGRDVETYGGRRVSARILFRGMWTCGSFGVGARNRPSDVKALTDYNRNHFRELPQCTTSLFAGLPLRHAL
jgi:hypothetical protein